MLTPETKKTWRINGLRYFSRFSSGCASLVIYTPQQIHDTIKLFRLSKQGIFDIAAPLYDKGTSLGAIARELGVPKTTVRQVLLDGGVELRPHSLRQLRCHSVATRISIRTAPYGTCVVNGQLVEDPKEAAVVRLIMKWWHQGMSHCAIACRLNKERIKPRKAKAWSQPTVGFIIKRNEVKNGSKEKNKWVSKN